MVKRKIKSLYPALVLLCIFSGCNPAPPRKVNARLTSPYGFYVIQSSITPDTVILSQCSEITEFSKKVKGNWQTHWSKVSWKIINVEKGTWNQPELSFVIADTWPTPQSGIMIEKMAFPYNPGRLFRFGLDSSKKLPVIVSQQECSRIYPYGPVKRIGNINSEIVHRIYASVDNFLETNKSEFKAGQIVESLDKGFVVECVGKDVPSSAVIVDSNSYEANWIPLPFEEK